MNKISKFWIQWNLTNTDPMGNIDSVFIYGVTVLGSVVPVGCPKCGVCYREDEILPGRKKATIE